MWTDGFLVLWRGGPRALIPAQESHPPLSGSIVPHPRHPHRSSGSTLSLPYPGRLFLDGCWYREAQAAGLPGSEPRKEGDQHSQLSRHQLCETGLAVQTRELRLSMTRLGKDLDSSTSSLSECFPRTSYWSRQKGKREAGRDRKSAVPGGTSCKAAWKMTSWEQWGREGEERSGKFPLKLL